MRTTQIGLSIESLDALTFGMVLDMFTESSNDECNYNVLADQSDFDRF